MEEGKCGWYSSVPQVAAHVRKLCQRRGVLYGSNREPIFAHYTETLGGGEWQKQAGREEL